jgi:MauM/NapG family ferredoxin protein
MNCHGICSRRAVEFTPGLSLSQPQAFDPGRREILISAGAVLAGVGLSRLPVPGSKDHPHRILPPGASEEEFLSSCLRCGVCLTACPTGGLQVSLLESGWDGFWAPVLVPRLGQCDYSCRACGRACPVGAIPDLALRTKRDQVIGKAFLNRERCIAWADEEDCIVCEEMCPVPDKAITLQPKDGEGAGDNQPEVQQPYIDRDLCIGCGICEHQCPVEGEAAVRVFTPGWNPDSRYW